MEQYIMPVADLLVGREKKGALQAIDHGENVVRKFLEYLIANHADDAVKAEAQVQLNAMDAQ